MKLKVEMTDEQLNLLILSTEIYARSLMKIQLLEDEN